MTTRWLALQDGHRGIYAKRLDTGVVEQIIPAMWSGLRGEILEVSAGCPPIGTDEFVYGDPHLIKSYIQHNSWIYDHPSAYDGPPPADLADRLQAMMAPHPYEFEVVALQSRFLLYFSDGNERTQRRYLRLSPRPSESVFDPSTGQLRPEFLLGPTPDEVQQTLHPTPDYVGRPIPPIQGGPLLYCGPAVVASFLLDGQNPAFRGCRVYVQPDGQFIASDWCQRSGRAQYEVGIDLQTAEYTFDSWVTGPCVRRAMEQRVFTPRTAKTRVLEVRRLRAQRPPPVPDVRALIRAHESAVRRLVQQGLPTVAVVQQVEQHFAAAKAVTGARLEAYAAKLHGVPVRLRRDVDWKPETLAAYHDCTVDSSNSRPYSGHLAVTGYAKHPFGLVKPDFLEVDTERCAALAERPGLEPAVLAALTAAANKFMTLDPLEPESEAF